MYVLILLYSSYNQKDTSVISQSAVELFLASKRTKKGTNTHTHHPPPGNERAKGSPNVRKRGITNSMESRRNRTKSCSRSARRGRCRSIETTPTEILVDEILGFLNDGSRRNFLEAAYSNHRLWHNNNLETKFCRHHGSKLEDSALLYQATTTNNNNNTKNSSSGHRKSEPTQEMKALRQPDNNEIQKGVSVTTEAACPTCYAKSNRLKRCGRCHHFYPIFSLETDMPFHHNNNGLWCQKCERMAFCNSCLARPDDDNDTHACGHSKGSECRSCCSNVFTNTICGDFVCDNCCGDGDGSGDGRRTVLECDICGKATCLDPHCLVCADFRLMNESIDAMDHYLYFNHYCYKHADVLFLFLIVPLLFAWASWT